MLTAALDLTTVLIVSAVIVTLIGILFVVDSFSRQDDPIGRTWSLAYLSGMISTFSYLASGMYPSLWWGIAVGNGAVVLSSGSVWAGARRFNQRRSLLWLALAAALLTALVAAVGVPHGGVWAGSDVMIGGTAVFGILAGIECFRRPMWSYRNGRFLGVVALLAGAYYAVRFVAYLRWGPLSPTFTAFAGTAISTLVVLIFVTGGAFAMVALRGEESRRSLFASSSPGGAEEVAEREEFDAIASSLLDAAERAEREASLVVADLDNVSTLNAAFGRAYGDHVLTRFVEVLREQLPAATPLSHARGNRFLFVVELAAVDAARLAEQIRESLLDEPLVPDQTGLRVTASFGVAGCDQTGYRLDALRDAAMTAVETAKRDGRNRVVQHAR
jgi:diguanylate cyclase (GGDEF)-like protein